MASSPKSRGDNRRASATAKAKRMAGSATSPEMLH
jgi:hypothetical protein